MQILPKAPSTRWLGVPVGSKIEFYSVFLLLFNVFTWFYMTPMMINKISTDFMITSTLRIVFYLSTIGSGFAGSLLSEKIRRFRMFSLWVIMGILSSALLALSYYVPVTGYFLATFILLGISFGLGMPSSMAKLADFTSLENRGRISAVIFWATNLASLPLAVALMLFSLPTCSLILALWRTLGLAALVAVRPMNEMEQTRDRKVRLSSILSERPVVLYLIPWIMFNLIDAFEKTVLSGQFGQDFLSFLYIAEPIIASFSILAAGWLCDRIGRKRVVLYGFVSLGIAYAVIGISPFALPAWYFYLIVDAIGTGILWITFILILWGDLSAGARREKYYLVGSIPFFARQIILILATPVGSYVELNAAFPLASFFLFLAVLPLVYAPETLPEKNIELIRAKGYIGQAKKMKDKYCKKTVPKDN